MYVVICKFDVTFSRILLIQMPVCIYAVYSFYILIYDSKIKSLVEQILFYSKSFLYILYFCCCYILFLKYCQMLFSDGTYHFYNCRGWHQHTYRCQSAYSDSFSPSCLWPWMAFFLWVSWYIELLSLVCINHTREG